MLVLGINKILKWCQITIKCQDRMYKKYYIKMYS